MSTITCTVTDPQEIKPGNLMQYCTDPEGNIIYFDGLPCVELFDGKPPAGVLVKIEEDKAFVQIANIPKEEE